MSSDTYFLSVPGFCHKCKCIDHTEDKYYLHIENNVAFCRSKKYEDGLQDIEGFKHTCQLLKESNSIKILMLKRKYSLMNVVLFHR